MMMPSPTHCSVEKPHNSSKKILFPGKTTRSANAIRFHCRSRTISHCIKGKAFLKTRHMSRPGILLDRNHDVGGGRSLSSNQSQWHRSHTVVCSMSSSLNIHIQCNGACTVIHSYSDTYVTLWCAACHTVEGSPHIHSHHYQKPEAGKANFGQKRPQRTLSQCHSRTFPAIIKFH